MHMTELIMELQFLLQQNAQGRQPGFVIQKIIIPTEIQALLIIQVMVITN